jgi:hypothetical protein
MNERELSALKSVIKCIEEHKLEQQYPVDPLQKRVLQLEKAKADKRMAVEAAKPQSKRPRANGSAFATRATGFADKSFYSATPERHPFNPCERQFVYGAEVHLPPMMTSASYTMQPAHGPYYGNGYPVQYQVSYIH